jgi:ferredoxin/flavodoxin
MENIIFYFSGTGNSLYIAKQIANEIGNCSIFSMGNFVDYELKSYNIIGFVFPAYYATIPNKVKYFIEKINLKNNQSAYFFAIATFRNGAGNSLKQFNETFTNQQTKLNYGNIISMLPNKKQNLPEIIEDIKNKKTNEIPAPNKIVRYITGKLFKLTGDMDKKYIVNDSCTCCGLCTQVCPVNNIEIFEKKPTFKHNCEGCTGCIQFCPQKAIKGIHDIETINKNIEFKEIVERNKI